jgi:bifunctional enzyme CysN/CysC
MATGASTADLAVILVDARKGVISQTRRHSRIVAMMGIRHAVLAINKMDLVDYSQAVFERIEAQYRAFAASLGFETIQSIPLSALEGDNILVPSSNTVWYTGSPLIKYLNDIEITANVASEAFRMPVQWVNRPNSEFRGFCGRIAQGSVQTGDVVKVLPSGVQTRVKAIVVWQGEASQAFRGDSITLTLAD